jgi:ABC-type iron transport system FetAB permease component
MIQSLTARYVPTVTVKRVVWGLLIVLSGLLTYCFQLIEGSIFMLLVAVMLFSKSNVAFRCLAIGTYINLMVLLFVRIGVPTPLTLGIVLGGVTLHMSRMYRNDPDGLQNKEIVQGA